LRCKSRLDPGDPLTALSFPFLCDLIWFFKAIVLPCEDGLAMCLVSKYFCKQFPHFNLTPIQYTYIYSENYSILTDPSAPGTGLGLHSLQQQGPCSPNFLKQDTHMTDSDHIHHIDKTMANSNS